MSFRRSPRGVAVAALVLLAGAFVAGAVAQGGHSSVAYEGHRDAALVPPTTSTPFLPTHDGEYAFATIAEIVDALRADSGTDWSRVDIAALREHLRDMSRVTLVAEVGVEPAGRGATFLVTSNDPAVAESIARMTADHSRTVSSGHGDAGSWTFEVQPIEGGARVTATGADEAAGEMIRALGFHGLLAAGDHHRTHHLGLATGSDPH